MGIKGCISTNQNLSLPLSFSDPTPHPIIARVTEIAQLVTQMLKHDWSLASHLQLITSQYFSIIQKYASMHDIVLNCSLSKVILFCFSSRFSPLPNPPSHLLAICLECIAVMAKHNSEDVIR